MENVGKKDLMIGKTISHYKILEKLGEGGMGVVYKAQDTKLDRIVALKFCPKHLLLDKEARTRFELEAKSASALNHPNITTIYEIDQLEDQSFISMEYVEGKTLRELVEEKPLTQKEIQHIAVQIAEGLQEAHQKGIVHRDIKSSNMMVTTKGQVKIMDFGLAKLKGVSRLTKTQTTLGTMQYMSPEQVQGMEVDQRSDIFSFGVVLYEIITGKLPFMAEYEAAVVYSIVNETPEPLSVYRKDSPDGLQNIIDKALEKDKDLRYQNAGEVLADLDRLIKGEEIEKATPKRRRKTPIKTGGLGIVLAFAVLFVFWVLKSLIQAPATPSVAVLDLENLGSQTDDYFAAGMTEAIITDLAKLSGLRVLSRSDVSLYKGKEINIKQLGKKLSVDYVIKGSIQKANHMLRITAQLVKTKDGFQVWAENYDNKTLSNVFEVQDEVAEKIAYAMKVKLSPAEKKRIKKEPTKSVLAYDYYLKGMDYFWKGNQKDLELALKMFSKALELDSNYALAYSGIGEVYATEYNYQRTLDWLSKSEQMVKKALALDPELAEAHLSLGRVYDFEKKYKEAIIEFKRVIELRPNSNDAYRRLGYVYQNGLYDYPEAIKFFQKALTIRPTDAKSYRGLGQSYASLRRYNQSIKVIKKGLELSPDDVYLLVFLGDAYRLQSMFEQAIGAYKKASEYHPDDHVISYYLGGYVYYSKKDYNEAIRIFEKSIHQGMPEFMVLIYIGSIYQHKGETQKARAVFDSSVVACKKVLEKEPQNPWALSHLGISYASLGNRREAMEKAREAVAIEPSAAQIYNLSMVYLILKKNDLALITLERACLKDPSYIDTAALEPDFERLKDYPEFQKLLKNRP